MRTFGKLLDRRARALCVLFAVFALREARAEVVSLTIGIDSKCPYGLVA